MNCQQYENLMMKYFDNIASDAETKTLSQHRKICANCQMQFKQMESSLSTLDQPCKIDIPKNFESLVIKRVKIYANKQKKIVSRVNNILAVFIWVVLSVPLAHVFYGVTHTSVFEYLMGLFVKMDIISSALITVLGTLKFTAIFIPVKNALFYSSLYAGVLIVLFSFIAVKKMFIEIKHSNI